MTTTPQAAFVAARASALDAARVAGGAYLDGPRLEQLAGHLWLIERGDPGGLLAMVEAVAEVVSRWREQGGGTRL